MSFSECYWVLLSVIECYWVFLISVSVHEWAYFFFTIVCENVHLKPFFYKGTNIETAFNYSTLLNTFYSFSSHLDTNIKQLFIINHLGLSILIYTLSNASSFLFCYMPLTPWTCDTLIMAFSLLQGPWQKCVFYREYLVQI